MFRITKPNPQTRNRARDGRIHRAHFGALLVQVANGFEKQIRHGFPGDIVSVVAVILYQRSGGAARQNRKLPGAIESSLSTRQTK